MRECLAACEKDHSGDNSVDQQFCYCCPSSLLSWSFGCDSAAVSHRHTHTHRIHTASLSSPALLYRQLVRAASAALPSLSHPHSIASFRWRPPCPASLCNPHLGPRQPRPPASRCCFELPLGLSIACARRRRPLFRPLNPRPRSPLSRPRRLQGACPRAGTPRYVATFPHSSPAPPTASDHAWPAPAMRAPLLL